MSALARGGQAVAYALASCQKRVAGHLFDHLVGPLLEEQRHVEAECLSGLEVDRQLELDRGLDGKPARLLALEDAIGIGRRASKIIGHVNSVGQQAAEFSEEAVRIDGREPVASGQRYYLSAMSIREAIRHRDKGTIWCGTLWGHRGSRSRTCHS